MGDRHQAIFPDCAASLDMLMNLFFVYYNGLRFHKGIGRVLSEVIAVLG